VSDAVSASAPSSTKRAIVVGAALAALTVLAYARVAGNGFTTFDDPVYVTQNPPVAEGLSLRGIAWAFTSVHGSNWHPVTWISHMIDCGLFGLRASGHHLVGLAFHVATSLLLLRLLLKTTGALLPSAFVAAVFALHPLHVESVAWASERKDVLCAFFWMLALLAYVRWVERPGSARYAVVLLWFVLGLLSKPMIVTLPLTMLLVDAWPLRRIGRATMRTLLFEKTPFFALSIASGVATYAIQRTTGAMELGTSTPFPARLGNAIVAYVAYLGKAVWPSDLQAYYPFPQTPYLLGVVVGAASLLALVTAASLRIARAQPWIAVGWLWYLATLLPVIGLVQVGGQAMADRYTYVPLIGVSIAVAWSFDAFAHRLPRARFAIAGASLACVAAWTALTWRQVGFWKDDASLYVIARAKIKDDALLGRMLVEQGRPWEAIELLRRAVEYDPARAETHVELGRALEAVGHDVDAEEEYRIAIRKKPTFAEAHFALATRLLARGRTSEGVSELQWTLALSPGDVRAQSALRRVREERGEKTP
jgi:tetratricopeptide (TPR) repeat protein